MASNALEVAVNHRGALVAVLCALAGCFGGDDRIGRQQKTSPDESLCASIVVRIAGVKPQRQTASVAIGENDEKCTPLSPNRRPDSRYLALSQTYSVTRSIDWNLDWVSNDHLRVDIFDCAEGRRHPDKSCLFVDSLSLMRKGPREAFVESGTRKP